MAKGLRHIGEILKEQFKEWYFPHICNCKKTVTEEEAIYIGDSKDLGGIDWFNCPHCKITFTKFRDKEKHEQAKNHKH